MSTIKETAMTFFDLCESGKGWQACLPYCQADAAFSVQAKSLEHLSSLEQYSDAMPQTLAILPDAHYKLLSVAADEEQQTVIAYAHFCATHTGLDGPVPATGKSTLADYVFIMQMQEGKVAKVTKVWNDGYTADQLGWV